MPGKTKAELEETVLYLERQLREAKKKLQDYEQHLKSCRTASPSIPPSDRHQDKTSCRPTLEEPLTDGRGSRDTTPSTEDTAPVVRRVTLVEHTALTNAEAYSNPSTLKDHEAANPNTNPNTSGGQSDGSHKRKKWELDTRSFQGKIKKPRYEPQCLEALANDAIIATIVCGISYDIQALSTNPIMDPIAAVTRYAVSTNPIADPIADAARYATIARDSQERAKLASRFASFQNLIFHSMCAVLEHCGHPKQEIDKAMRIRTSNSSERNLGRLRSGAVWANKIISELTDGEWTFKSDCIAELYFNFNLGISVFGCLAESKANTTKPILEDLRGFSFRDRPRSLCIPAFVRLGLPTVPLQEICVALGYKPASAQIIDNIVSRYKVQIEQCASPPGLSRYILPTGNDQTAIAERVATATSSGAQIDTPAEFHDSTSTESHTSGGTTRGQLAVNPEKNLECPMNTFTGGPTSNQDHRGVVNVDDNWQSLDVFMGDSADNQEQLTPLFGKHNVDLYWSTYGDNFPLFSEF